MSSNILLPDEQLQITVYGYAKFKHRCNVILARCKEDFDLIRKTFNMKAGNPVEEDSDTAVQTFFNGHEYITVVWYPEDRNLSNEELGKQLELAAYSVWRWLKERKEFDNEPNQLAFCSHFVNTIAEAYKLSV